MANSCFIREKYAPVDVARQLLQWTKHKDVQRLIDAFVNKNNIPRGTRYTLTKLDSTDEWQNQVINFNKSFDDAINIITSKKPDLEIELKNLKAKVFDTLCVDLDERASGSTPETDVENTTTQQIYDENQDDLNKHLDEIYGLGSFNVRSNLKEQFRDNIFAATYFNIASGEAVIRDNAVLNKNIIALKNKYFKQILDYLRQVNPDLWEKVSDSFVTEDGFQAQTYFSVLNAFYQHLHAQEDLANQLNTLSSNANTDQIKAEKTKRYTEIVEKFLENEKFAKTLNNVYRSGRAQDNCKNTLYEADHLSSYYYQVKRIAKAKGLDTAELETFEQPDINILQAAHAYTSLVHFDSLLIDTLSNAVDIKQGQKNWEYGDTTKYSFKQDTEHQRHDWQSSESVESEKYVANMTQAFLNQVRVFDYKTQQFQNRRLDSTTVIVAVRNLIDDIVYGKINTISWGNSNQSRLNTIGEVLECLADLHANPGQKLQKALTLLFENTPGLSDRLVDRIPLDRTCMTTAYDLNVLYSLYQSVLNTNNPTSVKSIELANVEDIAGPISKLSDEITGLVARNVTVHYLETSFDAETGSVQVKSKKRYFNNQELYKLRNRINWIINNSTQEERTKRAETFKFNTVTEGTTNKIDYSANIGDSELHYVSTSILSENGRFSDRSLFQEIAKVNLVNYKLKKLRGDALDEREQKLDNLLKFIDSYLGLNILTSPEQKLTQLEIFTQLDSNNLEELTKMAFKAAYVDYLYNEAGEKPFKQYLKDTEKDGLYRWYLNDTKHHTFTDTFGQLKITIASYKDEILEKWNDAYSMLTGEASKATTKNKEGSNIPNNSVNKLGTNLHHYLFQQKGTNADSLFFVQDYSKIRGVQHDLEATNMWQESKQVKRFSQSELFFHSIFNKFWGSYLQYGNFIIQPTCFADKTTFINYEISKLLFGDEDIIKDQNYQGTIVDNYIKTVGSYYKNIWEGTKNRLQAIVNTYNTKNGTSLTYQQLLAQSTEAQLVQYAKEAGVDIALDSDYRKVKGKDGKEHCVVNELLQYYSENLYGDKRNLRKFLNKQKKYFIQQFLDSAVTFQVINFRDSVANYLEDKFPADKSKNPIMQTILGIYANDSEGRKAFFANWVDAKTGKLILAKQGDKNIINNTNVDFSQDVEVNPLLDKYFYIEGFLSNNLRFSLTGSETNHPDKAFDTAYNAAKSCKSAKDYTDIFKQNISEEQFTDLQTFLANTNSVADFKYQEWPDSIKSHLNRIYEDSLETIANVAQSTQFKRNVIIPATLQYCIPKQIDGISAKTKCAVIRDEKAEVFNYRGDHEGNIDAADGSAKINPFQSILENKALGSQAVGFNKKPIIHSYDVETGGAFLAKFATNTITNETMRQSMNSTSSLYKLFKKMTNMQWQGDVDLMESIYLDQIEEERSADKKLEYFRNILLGNPSNTPDKKLYYKDKYGQQVAILNFDKTKTADGDVFYYTSESPVVGNTEGIGHKVYHMFYDNAEGKSIHITFDSYQQAQAFKQKEPSAHTINSLYELHTALGGINCVDSKGNFSEFNNEVVVNFMNAVGHLREGVDKTNKNYALDQDSYYQPLKEYHIGYALNNTAVKNGAKNINQKEAWSDDSELNYFEIDSGGIGMQMNADHDIINSELTEFSQVITATSAYGFTFDRNNEIFESLGRAAFTATEELQKSIDSFLENTDNPLQAQSDLYDAIGRIIMTSSSIKDKESLQAIIMEGVNSVFYKSKDHQQDSVHIPFSDPNIYADFIATLASTINKEAIKRKHPGSGCVMVPAYHQIQYFEVDGKKLMSSDILNRANASYKEDLLTALKAHSSYDPKTNAIGDNFLSGASIQILEDLAKKLKLEIPSFIDETDITRYQQARIKQYLDAKQSLVELRNSKGWFMPTDIVNITDAEGNILKTVELNSMDDYYKFKDGLNELELQHNVSIKADYKNGTYRITSPTATLNLYKDDTGQWHVDNTELSAIAAQIAGEIVLPDGTIVTGKPVATDYRYQENITRPHDLRPSLIRWVDNETGEYVNFFDTPLVKNAYCNPKSVVSNHQELIQKELNRIQKGQYTKADGSIGTIRNGSLENSAAELIMSNLYKERFGVENDSLADILEQGEDYFYQKFKTSTIPSTLNYDLAFTKDNGQHTLVSLHPVKQGDYIVKEDFDGNQLRTNADDEIHLYRGNRKLLKVGKWIDATDVTYKDGKFIKGNEVLDSKQYRLKDKDNPNSVQKRIDYVKKYKVTIQQNIKGRNVYRNNTLFEIAPMSDFTEALKNPNDAGKQRAVILSKLYELDNYKLAQINTNKSYRDANSIKALRNSLGFWFSNTNIKQEVRDLLAEQLDNLSTQTSNAEELKASGIKIPNTYSSMYGQLGDKESNWEYFRDDVTRGEGAEKVTTGDLGYKATIRPAVQFAVDSGVLDEKYLGYLGENSILTSKLDEIIAEFKKLRISTPQQLMAYVYKHGYAENDNGTARLNSTQLHAISKINKEKYKNLLDDFLKKEAHKRYISFLDSQNFIAARIPAQSLQSFMTMKNIAWTENSTNMAYVSHFQTYLQGSKFNNY